MVQAIINSAIVPLTYYMGKRMFNPRVGALAALLVAVSPYNNLYGAQWLQHGALDHAPGLFLLYLGLQDRSRVKLFFAGFATGLVCGGSRFSPFFLLLGMLWILWTHRGRMRAAVALIAWLVAGFLVTLAGLLYLFAVEPSLLGAFAGVLTPHGFMHLGQTQSAIGGRLVEFLGGFVSFDPLLMLLLAGALYVAARTRLIARQQLAEAEAFLWLFMVGLAFVLLFVLTTVDPSRWLGIDIRPVRYFLMFAPMAQLLGANWAVSRVEAWRPALIARWRRVLVALPLVGAAAAAMAIAAADRGESDSKFLRDLDLRGPATVLANWIPADLYRNYTTHSFAFPYRETYRRWRAGGIGFFPPVEFYSGQAFSGATPVDCIFHSQRVRFYAWLLNMPVFNLKRLAAMGQPVDKPRDLYFCFQSKANRARTNFRLHERQFRDAFRQSSDDWLAMRAVNPGLDWRPYLVRDDAGGVVLRLSLAAKAHRRLRLLFDRRETTDPQFDFTVSAATEFFPEFGFGWRTSTNLVDRDSWDAERVGLRATDRGVLAIPSIDTEFLVRTVPARYRVVWEWAFQKRQQRARLQIDTPHTTNAGQDTTEIAPGRFRTTLEATWASPAMQFAFSAPHPFFVYSMTLAPVE
jgi:hypothetical protein